MALSAALSDSSSGHMKQKPLPLSFVSYTVCLIMQGVMTLLSPTSELQLHETKCRFAFHEKGKQWTNVEYVWGPAQAGLKHENGRKVARSGSLQRVASAEHPAKKGCHGRPGKPEQGIKPEIDAI